MEKLQEKIQIDIHKILKKRAPRKYKYIPRFLIKYLKRKIHQEEFNVGLLDFGNKSGLEFIEEALKYLDITIETIGFENIPKNKKYVFASNHPLGGIDGLSLLLHVGREFGDVKAIINDILLNFKNLQPVLQGVNIYGKFSKQQITEINQLYESDNQIIVFPAGLVSRKIKGVVKDLPWKKSFLSKAIEYKRDIVPVFIHGKNSKFFYNFANFRKFIGFKFNIELIHLPDEMFNYKGKSIKIEAGEPISYKNFDKSKTTKEWVKYIRQQAYKLK